MYKRNINQDELFREWVLKQKHKIDILKEEGFDESQAIEILKVFQLAYLSDTMCNVHG